jgi:hypothetical protein
MTDPLNALQSFQEELLRGTIPLSPTKLDPALFVYRDNVDGAPRMTYARLEGKTVTVLVIFTSAEPFKGMPCVGIGYAVPEKYRKQGRAKEAIGAAIADMQYGLGRQGHSVFYVEAIVGADNIPSRRVAEQLISNTPVAIKDGLSGLPALQYLRKVEPGQDNLGVRSVQAD